MKALAAALLLFSLGACSSGGGDAVTQPAAPPVAGKPSPYAPPPPPMLDEGIVCAADVKQCPDGSYVSRNPARGCAFAPCPAIDNP
jgi:hypothetical protein